MTLRLLFAALIVQFASIAPAQVDLSFEQKVDDQAVKASLVADTTACAAGKPFTVGVRFEIEEGWDIYWQFVGDIGLPTRVDWELPAEFKAGPLQWPLPEAFLVDGNMNYVYHHEVMLMAEITPPRQLPAGPVEIKAKLKWQMCNDLKCIPKLAEEASLTLTSGDAQPANRELFAKWRAQLPKTDAPPFQATWEIGKELLTLRVAGIAREAKVEFFNLPPAGVEPKRAQIGEAGADGTRTITVPFSGEPTGIWRGVLTTQTGDGPRVGWILVAPAEASTAAPAKSGGLPAQPPLDFRALLAALGSAFIGGLLLNLMPCVLPVIGLKIYGFIGQAGEEPRRILRLGLAFSAGVLVFFLALAAVVVAFAAGGHTLNYGLQFQNPYVLAAILAVVFVFSLSLLGVFEIAIGGETATKLATLSQREGYGGAFMHGLFTTLLGTACTGPLLGPVLAIAFLRPGIVTFLVLGGMAVGMALPYVILTAKPAWMKFLPRPGLWMERLKQLMGFLMLAIVIALLWLIGLGRDANAVVAACAFLLVLGLASWVRGSWPRSGWSWLVALALAAAGWMYLIQGKLDAHMAASGVAETRDGLTWEPFSPQRVEEAIERKQPVFIDFTADWCLNCKVNEHVVLDTEPVRAVFKEKQFLLLKADWTNGDAVITDWLHKFNRVGVPVYVVYNGHSPEPDVLPEILTQKLVLERLKAVGP
jgi:thiol:disulfide interchange protein